MSGLRRFTDLARVLEAEFARGVGAPWSNGRFDELSEEVFGFQFEHNHVYRGFCQRRGVAPGNVGGWEDVPPVPATAFKFLDLTCVEASEVEATFLTSGTTSGPGRRGRHLVPSLGLYRASALPAFQAHLVPEDAPLPILSLIPHPDRCPESSLSTMMGFAAERWGSRVWWFAGSDGVPDVDSFLEAGAAAASGGKAALVAGTAFAFVHLLDSMAERGAAVALPPGSRVMETGGFKGRARVVERSALYRAIEERLGVPTGRIVNEYGMTELLSQLYEPVLCGMAPGDRALAPPPWLRVRALDPVTLEPVPEGTPGLLAFFDLANLGSVSHVLTQDLGTVESDGVRIRGRLRGSEPRGCSLALEDVLAASGGRP